MGKMELEMKKARFPAASRYVTYRAGPPEEGLRHLDYTAVLQIFVKEMGPYGNEIPENIKVTVEWDESAEGATD
ncbi:MAG: hypothetical protein AAE986_00765 [Thermoplasmataceae archaeon]|jgi:hypothetical protein|nr:hypothetical protein [Candidatus Thermoplasmatota archaeon]